VFGKFGGEIFGRGVANLLVVVAEGERWVSFVVLLLKVLPAFPGALRVLLFVSSVVLDKFSVSEAHVTF